jgi:hypothetical protein
MDDLACQRQHRKFSAQLMVDFGVKIDHNQDVCERVEVGGRGQRVIHR